MQGRGHDIRSLFRFVAVVLCLCSACSPGCVLQTGRFHGEPRRVKIPSGEVRLPVDWWCEFALVETTIDGQGPFRLLLDTGAGQSVVTPELAQRFPKQTFRIRRAPRGSSGRNVAVKKALAVHELQAGLFRCHSFDALVTDLSVVSDTLGTPIDGILGCPLFEGSLLEIDFPSKEVRVSVGTLAGERRDDQFQVSGDQRPYVPANFV